MEIDRVKEIDTPSLEQVLQLAKKKFLEKETKDPTLPSHPKHGQVRVGYTFGYVSYDTVDEILNSGVTPNKLSGKLMSESKISQMDELDTTDFDGPTWADLSRQIAIAVVKHEMPQRFPELVDENKVRSKIDPEV